MRMAHKIVFDRLPSVKKIEKDYQATVFSAQENKSLASALVDCTIRKIIQDDSLEEAFKRFARGACILNESDLAFALSDLRLKLAEQVFTVENGKKKVSCAPEDAGARPTLTSETVEKLGRIILNELKLGSSSRDKLIWSLSGMTSPEMPSNRTRPGLSRD